MSHSRSRTSDHDRNRSSSGGAAAAAAYESSSSQGENNGVLRWSVEAVAEHFVLLKLAPFAAALQREAVDGEALLALERADVRQLCPPGHADLDAVVALIRDLEIGGLPAASRQVARLNPAAAAALANNNNGNNNNGNNPSSSPLITKLDSSSGPERRASSPASFSVMGAGAGFGGGGGGVFAAAAAAVLRDQGGDEVTHDDEDDDVTDFMDSNQLTTSSRVDAFGERLRGALCRLSSHADAINVLDAVASELANFSLHAALLSVPTYRMRAMSSILRKRLDDDESFLSLAPDEHRAALADVLERARAHAHTWEHATLPIALAAGGRGATFRRVSVRALRLIGSSTADITGSGDDSRPLMVLLSSLPTDANIAPLSVVPSSAAPAAPAAEQGGMSALLAVLGSLEQPVIVCRHDGSVLFINDACVAARVAVATVANMEDIVIGGQASWEALRDSTNDLVSLPTSALLDCAWRISRREADHEILIVLMVERHGAGVADYVRRSNRGASNDANDEAADQASPLGMRRQRTRKIRVKKKPVLRPGADFSDQTCLSDESDEDKAQPLPGQNAMMRIKQRRRTSFDELTSGGESESLFGLSSGSQSQPRLTKSASLSGSQNASPLVKPTKSSGTPPPVLGLTSESSSSSTSESEGDFDDSDDRRITGSMTRTHDTYVRVIAVQDHVIIGRSRKLSFRKDEPFTVLASSMSNTEEWIGVHKGRKGVLSPSSVMVLGVQ